jgi:sec-independent protein translocase protein TatC
MTKFRRAESGMTLAEHLGELRRRFLIMAVSITLFAVLAFLFYPNLLKILQDPYCSAIPNHCKFLVTNPLDGLTLRVKIAFFGGFLISSPIILWQVWRFVTPGLKARERRYVVLFVSSSLLFFATGIVLAYFSFGHAIHFLKSIGGSTLITEYNPNQYLTLFLLMMFIFGLMFLFPVVLVALELANIVKPAQLLRGWRYAVITITIASAVFTPSGDPLSMAALAVPLVIFYFLAIGVGKLLHK